MADGLHTAFRVVATVPERSAGVTLVLDGTLPAEPGQFVMAWLPGIEERPFSIMDDDPLSLTVAAIGPFTRALCALQVGDRLWVRGPFGRGFPLSGARHLLIGGGSGAASLTLLAKRLRAQRREVVAVIGARTASQLMLPWKFAPLGIYPLLATDDGTAGARGTALDAARDPLDARWPDSVYACGPEPMLRAVAARTRALGLPCWVSLERAMKCGIGVCGNCHLGDQLVCHDGPVFPAELAQELWQTENDTPPKAQEARGGN